MQIENIPGINIQPGRSDSGARLPEELQPIVEIPVDICLWRASQLFSKVGSLLNVELNEAVYDSIELIADKLENDTFQFIANTYGNRKKSFRSTSNLRINTAAGYTSIKRVISGNSI